MPTYPVLAQTLSDHPSLQIFRTYSALNVKSILYYQAELAHLEAELAEIEDEDRSCNDLNSVRREFGEDWWSLKYGNSTGSGPGPRLNTSNVTTHTGTRQSRSRSTSPRTTSMLPALHPTRSRAESRQWELMCRIRVVLDEYYHAISRQLEIESNYQTPHKRDLANLRSWLDDSRLGKCFLAGKTEDIWDEGKGYRDYVTIAETGDTLSNRIAWLFLALRRILRREFSRKVKGDDVESLGAREFQRMVNGTLTVLASILPVLPIVVLFVVRPLAVRIGLVFLFTILLSGIVTFGLQINAERVLAITTAFAAVLVVFIATNQS